MIDSSTDKYIDKIVKRYSKLFGLPSQNKLILYLGILSLHGGIISILPLKLSFENFFAGFGFGGFFFLSILLSDFIISHSSLKNDLVFNFRRCLALSFFSSLIWLGIIILGTFFCVIYGTTYFWLRFLFLGFIGALILRQLVLSITSFTGLASSLISSLLQPLLVFIPIIFLNPVINYGSRIHLLVFLLVSVCSVFVIVFIFKYFMDHVGKKSIGIKSSVLFKAFLANWTEDLIGPLEHFFEKLGNTQDVKVSLLTFKAGEKLKAVIVVPGLHPGPFKNLGSSLLPFLIQKSIQERFGCVVSVPHGLVGHDFDVASQVQNQRVLEYILKFVDSSSEKFTATQMLRTKRGDAKTSCQIFGDCALITLTTAPKTMEDLPPELEFFITHEAKKRGFNALSIDAHNSMGGRFDLENAIKSFSEASIACLENALKSENSPFRIGASNIEPQEFSVQDGMGHGGISVIVSEVEGKKAAYVTIDGNNMVSGLREKIISSLKEIGIDGGEVLTTDTHSVCGMIRSSRGYNLVGEAIDHLKLVNYIRKATSIAIENMELATVSWCNEIIPDVRVIGEKQITELTVLADETTERVKKVAMILFPAAAAVLSFLFLI